MQFPFCVHTFLLVVPFEVVMVFSFYLFSFIHKTWSISVPAWRLRYELNKWRKICVLLHIPNFFHIKLGILEWKLALVVDKVEETFLNFAFYKIYFKIKNLRHHALFLMKRCECKQNFDLGNNIHTKSCSLPNFPTPAVCS